jgi:nickel/cobalt exporter
MGGTAVRRPLVIAVLAVLGWLGFASGALVTVIGAGALASAIHRRSRRPAPHGDHHAHDHTHDHEPVPAHGPDHHGAHEHSHEHSHGHSHSHDHGPGKWGIAGLGIAGGLVPSPSALIVLLGAAALGRTVFGVLLVIAYGLGMAATLTAAGLLLIRLRDRLEGRLRLLDRWRSVAPSATAALILVVGLGLAGRALAAVA